MWLGYEGAAANASGPTATSVTASLDDSFRGTFWFASADRAKLGRTIAPRHLTGYRAKRVTEPKGLQGQKGYRAKRVTEPRPVAPSSAPLLATRINHRGVAVCAAVFYARSILCFFAGGLPNLASAWFFCERLVAGQPPPRVPSVFPYNH